MRHLVGLDRLHHRSVFGMVVEDVVLHLVVVAEDQLAVRTGVCGRSAHVTIVRPNRSADQGRSVRPRSTVGDVDPVIEDVLAANRAFYDAHEARDLDAMRSVWEHSQRTVCVHPGWPILRTWPIIEESWRRILEGPGRNQFILTNEAVAIHGDIAWVTLDENLVDASGTGTVAATNLYARSDDAWLLVAHHGSPVISR